VIVSERISQSKAETEEEEEEGTFLKGTTMDE